MRIRSKLLLLIYGIVILSLICVIVFAILFSGLSHGKYVYDEETGIGAPWNMHGMLRTVFEEDRSTNRQLDSDVFLIADDSGVIYYLNPSVSFHSDHLSGSDILQLITSYYTDRGLVFTRYQYKDSSGTLVYFSRWLSNVSNRMTQVISSVILISIFFLVVPALLGMRIVTKLRRNLITLENGIVSISDGVTDISFSEKERSGDLKEIFIAVEMMAHKLKEEEDRRSRFFLAVSHDLKTPLTSIKGYLEAIQDGIPRSEEEFREYIDIMKEKADLLESRILGLIEYAVFDSGNLIQKFLVIEAFPFLQTTAKMFKKEAAARHIELHTVVDFDPKLKIKGNTKLLLRCFENLFDNAVKYSQNEHPVVEIFCHCDAHNFVFSIRDNGAGIPEAEQKNIFEPFYRSDKNRNRPGFGLGLSSAKSIVELHGGEISCFNHPNGGAVVMLTIPIYNAESEQNKDEAQEA